MYRIVPVTDYQHKLEWSDDLGIGYLKSTGYVYGEEYWKHYLECSASEFGCKLTQLRLDFVKKHLPNTKNLCDVGIGSGRFVELANCKGTDVNEFALDWLKKNNRFADDVTQYNALTMWDVIEHVDDVNPLLSAATHIFLSTPIYHDMHSCMASKHFKPCEHIWYFTDRGIKKFMEYHGFELQDQDDFETVLGRDSILSYYFRRK